MKMGDGICPNYFESVKSFLIANAEGKLTKYLPYAVSVLPYIDTPYHTECALVNLYDWYMALSSDNPSSGPRVDFGQNPKLYRELIEPIQLYTPVKEDVVKSIRNQFIVGGKKNTVEVDAVAIEEEGGL